MQTEHVWPIPQEMRLTGDTLSLEDAVISLPGRPTRPQAALAQLLADMVMDDYNRVLPIVRGRVPAAKKPIRIGVAGQGGVEVPADLPGPEGYLLEVTDDGVSGIGHDARGARGLPATVKSCGTLLHESTCPMFAGDATKQRSLYPEGDRSC